MAGAPTAAQSMPAAAAQPQHSMLAEATPQRWAQAATPAQRQQTSALAPLTSAAGLVQPQVCAPLEWYATSISTCWSATYGRSPLQTHSQAVKRTLAYTVPAGHSVALLSSIDRRCPSIQGSQRWPVMQVQAQVLPVMAPVALTAQGLQGANDLAAFLLLEA